MSSSTFSTTRKEGVQFALQRFGQLRLCGDALVPRRPRFDIGHGEVAFSAHTAIPMRDNRHFDAGFRDLGWPDLLATLSTERGISPRRRRAKGQALAMISSFLYTSGIQAAGLRRCGSSISASVIENGFNIGERQGLTAWWTERFSRSPHVLVLRGRQRRHSPPSAITQR